MSDLFEIEDEWQISSIVSSQETSYSSYSKLNIQASSENNIFEYNCSEDYCQNVDIGRVTVKRSHSKSRQRGRKKLIKYEEDEQSHQSDSKEKRSNSRQRSQKTTSGTNNNEEGSPRIAIQFDLNKLLEEISKADRKTCALCGKPKKRTKEQTNENSSKKCFNSKALKNGKFSFFLNDQLKITIEDDASSQRNKAKKDLETPQKSDTIRKNNDQRKASTYTNLSDAYAVETVSKIPCPSSCPMVKLQRLINPDDSKILSCITKKSQITNTHNPKDKKNKSLQTSRTKECGTSCPRKIQKRKMKNTLQPDDIKVTCKGENGDKNITQEIVKDGDNVKIIIKVKKPNTPTDSHRKYSTSSANLKSEEELPNLEEDASYQMRSSIPSRKSFDDETASRCSTKQVCSRWNCPFKTVKNENSTIDQPSKTGKVSTINIIMSPRSTVDKISKSQETIDRGTNECWSKLEEFIDKKIQEFRPDSKMRHDSNKYIRSKRATTKRKHPLKKKVMVNRSLAVPSSMYLINYKDRRRDSGNSSSKNKISKVCFNDEVERIRASDSKTKSCSSEQTFQGRSDSGRILGRKGNKPTDSQIKLLCRIESINLHESTKSEGDMFNKKCIYRPKLEGPKSLCTFNGNVCQKNCLENFDFTTHQGRRRSRSVEEEEKLEEISIQTDFELEHPLLLKISGVPVDRSKFNVANISSSEISRTCCECNVNENGNNEKEPNRKLSGNFGKRQSVNFEEMSFSSLENDISNGSHKRKSSKSNIKKSNDSPDKSISTSEDPTLENIRLRIFLDEEN
ncbi:uncharacterized protein LOC123681664 [Harmonia axyridis]|uniref:uncharacterized protein LOC123681664 n=1 Tax=Harmonia axyridis TaxID=115357 RepID=UPI001E27654F|nr:uncharacterized protein LOC123681664 [Harmonia axyridis]